jgi:fatty acid amide hydrolase 2
VWQGLPQTAGLTRRRDVIADRDAEVVRRLRDAGGIVLGVTNVAEGGLWMESFNPIFGLTRNPWDLRRSAGGSSGGEAALIAAGGAPFGVGADIGGSIRIPAAFCGIFGHKPTGGLVPNTGHWPGDSDMGPVLTVGPMCRRAEDLMPLLRLMAGPDGADATCHAMTLGDPDAVDLRRVRVFAVDEIGAMRFAGSTRGAIRRAGEALAHAGARVEHLKMPDLKAAYALWTARVMTMGRDGLRGDPGERRGHRYAAGAAVLGAAAQAALGAGGPDRRPGAARPAAAPADFGAGEAARRAAGRARATAWGDDGVLLHPAYSRPAPRTSRRW